MLRIAAYQGVGPIKSIDAQLQMVKMVLQDADTRGVDIVCFPECFLTGYYSDRQEAEKQSLSLSSPLFSKILSEISTFRATAVLGFNETSENHLFNSVAVIDQGTVLGIQRKHFLYHNYFTSGTDFIPIPIKGAHIGILVCLDSKYLEPARILSLKGAKILLVPTCNQVPLEHPLAQKPEYYSHFIARAHENNCWLFAADWSISSDGNTVCPGHSCIYNPDGKEILRSNEGEQLLIENISNDHLTAPTKRRVTGSEILNSKLSTLLANKHLCKPQGGGV